MKKKSIGKYYCFNEKGECELPSKQKVAQLKLVGKRPILFLDSNVCLNIVKVVDFGKKATDYNRPKILHLKDYISKTGVSINGLFGLIELSQKDGMFDQQKFRDFKHRLDFFEQISQKYFNRFSFDFERDYVIYQEPVSFNDKDNGWYHTEPIILLTYCSLLKIRELALKGLSRKEAKSNIYEFTDWMSQELGLMLGVEQKLAISIFGGRTEYRKMVWLDGNPTLAKKKLMGTVWDIYHSRHCINNHGISKRFNENIDAYFLTNDYNLFKLLSRFSLIGILDGGGEIGSTYWYNSDMDLPHLDEEFLVKHNYSSVEDIWERATSKLSFDKEKVIKQIRELEYLNGI